MPGGARREIVADGEVGVYHCVARCVRRAFLCGLDPASGQSFEHRKNWIEDRLRELAGAFGIDVCGFAVLSNHLHLVLRTRPERTSGGVAGKTGSPAGRAGRGRLMVVEFPLPWRSRARRGEPHVKRRFQAE